MSSSSAAASDDIDKHVLRKYEIVSVRMAGFYHDCSRPPHRLDQAVPLCAPPPSLSLCVCPAPLLKPLQLNCPPKRKASGMACCLSTTLSRQRLLFFVWPCSLRLFRMRMPRAVSRGDAYKFRVRDPAETSNYTQRPTCTRTVLVNHRDANQTLTHNNNNHEP